MNLKICHWKSSEEHTEKKNEKAYGTHRIAFTENLYSIGVQKEGTKGKWTECLFK
jgi:hypothetical protein